MSKVQTSRAPDLLAIEEVLPPPPAAAEGEIASPAPPAERGPREFRARIGTVKAPVEKVGRRAGDTLDRIVISQADFKRIAKEAYRLGWSAKCMHVAELFTAMTQEIGE